MSTIEKNIKTIQDKILTFEPGSRNYVKYHDRLAKKVKQFMKYKETRTRDESVEILNLLKENIEINLEDRKLTDSVSK